MAFSYAVSHMIFFFPQPELVEKIYFVIKTVSQKDNDVSLIRYLF